MPLRKLICGLSAALPLFATPSLPAQQGAGPETLEQRLLREDAAALAQEARRFGDAAQGAIVFYQPYLTCTKCHLAGDEDNPLGPDLSKPDPEQEFSGLHVVQSVLEPSKVIRKGYEPVMVFTDQGKPITGLLVEETAEVLRLRDPATTDGSILEIPIERIDEQMQGRVSVMPTGLINTLTSRQQFLDLVCYLIEIAEQGPDRARELEPPPELYAMPPIPEYEQRIDHAGMIADLDEAALERGEKIYNRLCVNCHGTHDRPGSLPTSLRFAEGQFKNGSDPYSMYQTLTRGYGMMMPQTWMVPRQKYDAVHYIRETYLRDDNPSQYARVDQEYLEGLPVGDTRGPEPSSFEPWIAMDYGPSLTATYEIGDDGTNFVYKGIAVRLDVGPGGISRGSHWMLYDEDTLRLAGAWTGEGFIDWRAILFDGQHNIHPRIVGQVHMANPTGPGWANPADGGFGDVRIQGRDGRRYGPLPRKWARYRGLYHWGNRVLLRYTVGTAEILEMPGVETAGEMPLWTRTMNIGPRRRELLLQVARHDAAAALDGSTTTGRHLVLGGETPAPGSSAEAPPDFTGDAYVLVRDPADFEMSARDFSITARVKTRSGGTIFSKTRAVGQWVPGGKTWFVRNGRLVYDIGWVGAVQGRTRVDDGRWHEVAMTWQHASGTVRLYVDGRLDGEGRLRPKPRLADAVVRLGYTSTDFPRPESFFRGQLRDVRFFPCRLTDEAVADRAWPEDPGPVGHWPLERIQGSAVEDASGRGHAGEIHRGQPKGRAGEALVVGVDGLPSPAEWRVAEGGRVRLVIPAGDSPLRLQLWFAAAETAAAARRITASRSEPREVIDLEPFTRGGPPRWPDRLSLPIARGDDAGPFAIDVLTHPDQNPWLCRTRFTGIDFLDGGRQAAVCSWDGDVWLVSGIDQPQGELTWQRIASGLFQPLGLKIVGGQIYVTCRDQIVILRDLNGDGETDFYECFNNDHQVTDHFHEFAMGLQTDAEGNFYYAKGARHGLPAVVPHHGTLLRVSRDGSRTEILERGFRAPNGVCVNPDGTFFTTDQEGHWIPKNRINWLRGDKRFWGNFWAYHDLEDSSDDAMEQPVCWITNSLDRSPAELTWVDSPAWGPLDGSLLQLSYGYGKMYIVPHEIVDGRMQGGMSPLPLGPFPTGVMRGRFHPRDGQLYACGMFAWAGNQQEPGGFYRVRYTGRPPHVPLELHAVRAGVRITFSDPLDPESVGDPANWQVKIWHLNRSERYGSDHIDERRLDVRAARLESDRRTVRLEIPEIQPTWCMEIKYRLRGADGTRVDSLIHNTIHAFEQ